MNFKGFIMFSDWSNKSFEGDDISKILVLLNQFLTSFNKIKLVCIQNCCFKGV